MKIEVSPKEAYILLRLITAECPDNRIIKDLKQKLYDILGDVLKEDSEKSFLKEYTSIFTIDG